MANESTVEHVQFGEHLDHKVMLRQLADDDQLKGAVVVCLWDDGTISTGWANVNTGEVALASIELQQKAIEDASR